MAIEEPEMGTKSRKTWSAVDAKAIHRVASRVGWVGATQSPQEAVRVLGDVEEQHHRDPDARLRLLREIADNACHEAAPACIRCPLSGGCLHQKSLQQQRQTAGQPARRLWQR
jgi:endonuclease III